MKNLSYLLIKASRHLKNALDKKLKDLDVTATQFSVLYQISLKNGQITSVEVASRLSSDKPTISEIVNRLERKGLLRKVHNPDDKRSAFLQLNDQAITLVEQLMDASDQLNSEVLIDFNEHEIENMESYLMKIIRRVE